MARMDDLCFATLYCDSLLITASSSTFAWWIGYLMEATSNPKRGRIFYNSEFNAEMNVDLDNFLPEWIPVRQRRR
ncbi:galactoside 2-alpha-L-fucosyltransferase [Ditylenchus destructor]|nr:galactoside 2-alpha-L-fucosyltransferase [Ditylenchus destructor]